MNKKTLIKNELGKIKKESNRTVNLQLADLVMMQMVGNFDEFLEKISSGEEKKRKEAHKDIEKTKEKTTTPQLYPSIVRKTIESQFAEKHVTLRELGQNAIDSYNLKDENKIIEFTLEKKENCHVLKVRDYGIGMNFKELVRDLLIPYNSGKELDPTKIGEHGIGWYSIVDLAELVKVTTRKKGTDNTVKAIVYGEKENWKTVIAPHSGEGFEERNNLAGTEVCAFIPAKAMDEEVIKEFIYRYLGMVDVSKGKILFNGELINSLRESYKQSNPVQLSVEGEEKPIIMGFSKRAFHGELVDPRFKHRDHNLDNIVFTQRGLFVKYDSAGFDDNSVHAKLLRDLGQVGLDFWVELPENITLTKRRNDVIADHAPIVLKGVYDSFENLFLDNLLSDEEILNHPSGILLGSIAGLLESNYQAVIKESERRRYSLGRRFSSSAAKIGSKTIDVTAYVLSCIGKGTKHVVTLVPEFFKGTYECTRDLSNYVRTNSEKITETTKKAALIGVPAALATSAIIYGGIQLYNLYGLKPVWYALGGVACLAGLAGLTIAGSKIVNNLPEIKAWSNEKLNKSLDCIVGAYNGLKSVDWEYYFKKRPKSTQTQNQGTAQRRKFPYINIDFKGGLEKLVDGLKKGSTSILNKMGLYVDVEAKREKKRQKLMNKISKKYLSKLHKDEFFKKIMSKKIISADFYFTENTSEAELQESEKHRSESFSTLWKESMVLLGIKNSSILYGGNESIKRKKYWNTPKPELQKAQVKLSIDELVEIHLKRKLTYAKGKFFYHEPKNGEYFVDYTNPVVRTIVDKIENFSFEVRDQYDVKVLEDHLDNLGSLVSTVGLGIYFLSGVALIHIGLSKLTKKISNPLETVSMYKNVVDRTKYCAGKVGNVFNRAFISPFKGKGEVFAKGLAKGLKCLALAPVFVPYYIGKGTYFVGRELYEHLLVPSVKAINPKEYPSYARSVKDRCIHKLKLYREKRAYEKERKEEIRREREEERQRRKELEKDVHRESFFKRISKGITNWYERSTFNKFFGYGIVAGENFKNLKRATLEQAINTADVGQVYVDFLNAVESVEQIISDAVGEKPSKITLDYTSATDKFSGFSSDKKGTIHINIKNTESLIEHFRKRIEEKRYDPNQLAEFDVLVLDLLLHYKVITSSEKKSKSDVGEYTYNNNGNIKYFEGFFEKKSELRRKVFDYIQKEGINLADHISSFAKSDKEQKDYYKISPEHLSRLIHMTRRRLIDERMYCDKLKQENTERRAEKLRKTEEELLYLEAYLFSNEDLVQNIAGEWQRTFYSDYTKHIKSPEEQIVACQVFAYKSKELLIKLKFLGEEECPELKKILVGELEDAITPNKITNYSGYDAVVDLIKCTDSPVEKYFLSKRIAELDELDERKKDEIMGTFAGDSFKYFNLRSDLEKEIVSKGLREITGKPKSVLELAKELLDDYLKNSTEKELNEELQKYITRGRGQTTDSPEESPVGLLHDCLRKRNNSDLNSSSNLNSGEAQVTN